MPKEVQQREGIRRAHVVIGGFPVGEHAGHDHDYVRVQLLSILQEDETVHATVASDFTDLDKWLPGCDFLVTYVAGPYADGAQQETLHRWVEGGGRWFGLHGTSGGRTRRVQDGRRKQMVKQPFHETLGGFFLNHEPVRRFDVTVDTEHAITRGLPSTFETADEPYQVEILDPSNTRVLLTNALGPDSSPPGFGFVYDEDTSLQDDGLTRVLGYVRRLGRGEVAYVALGHTHSPTTNFQPFVHTSVDREGKTPPRFRGSWEREPFRQLLRNAVAWGVSVRETARA